MLNNGEMRIKSYAKLNLFLDILKRRENGYHDISTLFHLIDLYDIIEYKISEIANLYGEDKFEYKINIECSDSSIPVDSTNLVHRAISLIIDNHYKRKNKNLIIDVKLEKNIPAGGGLGGGSSNGATSLLVINQLLELGLGDDELKGLALQIGADFPFFLVGGTAIGEGIGEKLEIVENFPKLDFVLVFPDFPIDTAWTYKNLKLRALTTHPDLRKLILEFKKDFSKIDELLYNALESVVIPRYDKVEKIKRVLLDNGCSASIMTGSGSTIFGIMSERVNINKLTSDIEKLDSKIIFVSSLQI